jgi:phosphoribosylaminoimidazolecarboxamide formyltransferase/IMP cyclohydrolase
MVNPVRRALVSVFNKEGIVEFCKTLTTLNIEIVSSGGTARTLEENGIKVTKVSDYTGFPEMLDGRVKTLHPRIHGGLLAIRSNADHMADLERNNIEPIDLVVVNLYPFEQTVAAGGSREEVIEMIDIGGPTLIRAAAKNHTDVAVVVSPSAYAGLSKELKAEGHISADTRRRLAVEAFQHTSSYDRTIHAYLSEEAESVFKPELNLQLVKCQDMRYGENPHQRAAFYRDPSYSGPAIANAEQLQGKELSFNNILDFDAALSLCALFSEVACVIIKHGNPCGTALGSTPLEAFERALSCDPQSAFGGVIAFNRPVDAAVAEVMAKTFFEGIVAPDFDDAARQALARKKKLRLLTVGELTDYRQSGFDLRRVNGGLLAQDWDLLTEQVREATVVTTRQPTEDEWRALVFAWTVCKQVKSNAIIYTSPDRTLGIGAGQMSRVDSARLAVQKANHPLAGAVMASDAFFPFRDGLDVPAEAGITAVVQPGGSIRDKEVIDAANEHGMAMVFTGRRHFRH